MLKNNSIHFILLQKDKPVISGLVLVDLSDEPLLFDVIVDSVVDKFGNDVVFRMLVVLLLSVFFVVAIAACASIGCKINIFTIIWII